MSNRKAGRNPAGERIKERSDMKKTADSKSGPFRLEEGLNRIVSPVTLIFPDLSKMSFDNGQALAAAGFDRPYIIKSIAAVDDEVGIILEEPEA